MQPRDTHRVEQPSNRQLGKHWLHLWFGFPAADDLDMHHRLAYGPPRLHLTPVAQGL